MSENKVISIRYAKRALQQALLIRNYLEINFSQKEINAFYEFIESFEKVIIYYPKLYNIPNKKVNVRRAVLSRELSIYYRLNKHNIDVIAILDNRCNYKAWLK